ncbi:AAA family ATPase [Pandoraea apista]|uniref:ATPase AAA n=1 Tax=Pandoraea apista TaxID=93218 RepID=A0A0G4JLA8_9BURK|nr:ATP-binding protein [Pandoraea apista]ALS64411.1 AAA family ATPase [Pandoraea apista]OXS88608.1 AAA family ATPase [Pandoraea apista]RRW99388.1 AAA family ATPase [Pandoraea apista]RRX07705.1 AAA family ATPase [Pandoraea apista]CFB64122.1 ATPase family associated with various cellular activities (AAA) [Pandoraea apista]
MDFEIPESLIHPLMQLIGADSPLGKQLTAYGVCRGNMMVSSEWFDAKSLNTLYVLSKTQNERALMFQMLALDNVYNAPQARQIPDLDKLVPGLVAYLSRDVIDGWVYQRHRDGALLPWLVRRLRYVEPEQGSPYVVMDMLANTMQSANSNLTEQRLRRSGMTTSLVFTREDIANRTIPELLAEFGFYKECAEFKHEYEQHAQRFLRVQRAFGAQFVLRRAAFSVDPKGATELIRVVEGVTAKCVNDEERLERNFEMVCDADFWRKAQIDRGFETIPLHCYVHVFHLDWHRNLWVHVQNMTEYEYQPALRDKLVLPAHHHDLIDILTSNMDVMMPDFVPGKSGGATILCQGAPGLGKTLTAEIYSEVVGKPLYRVHSGQLGTTAASVGATLMSILRRAMRWNAILLLDEADVYIRRRDNDLEHNAIVAEFLRSLEYFHGLLFMTTNRIGDVDDAILSRCIATIHYEIPCEADARRLWRMQAEQVGADLDDALIEWLATCYSHASGRDIKELMKLASRYCKVKDMPYTEDVFKLCGLFRGYEG